MKTARPFLIRLLIIGPPALLVLLMAISSYMEFTAWRDVFDYLKLAADAPSLSIAERYLSTAVRNMEARGWTSGSTALFLKVPRLDIGLWYQNTNGALTEVKSLIDIDKALTPVDRSNALVKLRETLMDGTQLTFPESVEIAPYNRLFFCLGLLAIFGSINSIVVFLWMVPRSWWMSLSRTTPIQTPAWLHAIRRWIEWQASVQGSAGSRRR